MFASVYPILREFGDALREDDWRRLFDYRFGAQDYRGWVSIEGDEIIGYLGAIFSQRGDARFCCLTSWIHKKEHRKADLRLLVPMFDLTDHTLLNLSPSPFTLALFKRLGFEVLDDDLVLIPPVTPRFTPRGHRLVTVPAEIEKLLDARDAEIYHHHQPYRLRHMLLVGPNDYCYIVASRTWFRRWPVSFIHYASNRQRLSEGINAVQADLLRGHRTLLTAIDGRLVEGYPIRGAYHYKLNQPRLYKPAAGDAAVAASAIDSLYSEFVVLNPRRWSWNF